MKKIIFKVCESDQMIHLGKLLTNFVYPNLVIALNGDLGSGKTTFTKGIGLALGVKRVINSPTFTIMKTYEVTNHLNNIDMLYHLDVYRLNNSVDDFSLSEYFEWGGLTVIEWADIIDDLLPESLWKMEIRNDGENQRIVALEFFDNTDIAIVEKVLRSNNYEIIN